MIENIINSSLSKYDKSIFKALIEIAIALEPNNRPRARIAAALSYKNVVVLGINSYRTDPTQLKFSKCADAVCLHAEIEALKRGQRLFTVAELKRSVLYVLRLKYESGTKTNIQLGLAMPCDTCMRAIEHYGIKRVWYTTENNVAMMKN